MLYSCTHMATVGIKGLKYGTASNLNDLFHNIHPKYIISFIHAIGLTNKI